jgi:Putative MetA-pathway of phenol degradation
MIHTPASQTKPSPLRRLTRRLRACEVFRRARAGGRNGVDLGAKHSRSSGYGEHLQRRAAPFRPHERVWRNASQALRALTLAAALPLLALHGAPAHALDLDADDYASGAIPAGTSLALLYYQHAQRNKVYSNGAQVAGGDLKSDVGILRLVHFIDILGFRADPQILLPFGSLKASNDLSALGSTSGVGDLIVTGSVWLINKPAEGEFLGITPAVWVPIGNYDKNKQLNLGEKRWKYLLQVGYTTPLLTKDLSLQLAADVTAFGDNDDFGPGGRTLSQKPLYQFQAWLKYNLSPTFDLRAGTSHFTGGKTEVDGVANDDRTKTTNAKLGFGWSFSPGWNFAALYGRDLSVRNGPKESDRVNLRLLKAF